MNFIDVSLSHYITLSLALFSIGLFGVLYRKNILVLLMSIELMLNSVNLIFISAGQYYQIIDAHIITFFVMTIASAEAGVGLALAVQIYKRFKSISTDSLSRLKG